MATWVQNHLLLPPAGDGVEEETGNKGVPMVGDKGVSCFEDHFHFLKLCFLGTKLDKIKKLFCINSTNIN